MHLVLVAKRAANNDASCSESYDRDPCPYGALDIVKEGAYADFLIDDGNTLEDLTVLWDYRKKLKLIMQDGKILKNTIVPAVDPDYRPAISPIVTYWTVILKNGKIIKTR